MTTTRCQWQRKLKLLITCTAGKVQRITQWREWRTRTCWCTSLIIVSRSWHEKFRWPRFRKRCDFCGTRWCSSDLSKPSFFQIVSIFTNEKAEDEIINKQYAQRFNYMMVRCLTEASFASYQKTDLFDAKTPRSIDFKVLKNELVQNFLKRAEAAFVSASSSVYTRIFPKGDSSRSFLCRDSILTLFVCGPSSSAKDIWLWGRRSWILTKTEQRPLHRYCMIAFWVSHYYNGKWSVDCSQKYDQRCLIQFVDEIVISRYLNSLNLVCTTGCRKEAAMVRVRGVRWSQGRRQAATARPEWFVFLLLQVLWPGAFEDDLRRLPKHTSQYVNKYAILPMHNNFVSLMKTFFSTGEMKATCARLAYLPDDSYIELYHEVNPDKVDYVNLWGFSRVFKVSFSNGVFLQACHRVPENLHGCHPFFFFLVFFRSQKRWKTGRFSASCCGTEVAIMTTPTLPSSCCKLLSSSDCHSKNPYAVHVKIARLCSDP